MEATIKIFMCSVDYWCDNFGIGLRKTSFHQRNCYKKRDDRCLIEVLNTHVFEENYIFLADFFLIFQRLDFEIL